MDHLDILKEATRTISSPRRFIRGKFVTDQGGCSIGHLVVASQGGVTAVLGGGIAAGLAKDRKGQPELCKAAEYVAKAMVIDQLGLNYCEGDTVTLNPGSGDPVDIVAGYNDRSSNSHEQIVAQFKKAVVMAEADAKKAAEPEPAPAPVLDFDEVDSLLSESAEQEGTRELVAA